MFSKSCSLSWSSQTTGKKMSMWANPTALPTAPQKAGLYNLLLKKRDVNHSYGPSGPLKGDFQSVSIHKEQSLLSALQEKGNRRSFESQLPSTEWPGRNFIGSFSYKWIYSDFFQRVYIESVLISALESFVRGHLDKTIAIIHATCQQFVNPYSVPEWLIIFLRIWSSVCVFVNMHAHEEWRKAAPLRPKGRNKDQHRFLLCHVGVFLILQLFHSATI